MVLHLVLLSFSLGTITEQNSKIPPTLSRTLRDENVTTLKTMNSYDGARPKMKTSVPLTPLQQSLALSTPKGGCIMYWKTPVTHKFPPKLTENEEVLHHLKDDINTTLIILIQQYQNLMHKFE